jgi:hypothetical protein
MSDVIATFKKTADGLIDHDGVYPNFVVYEAENGSANVEFVERCEPIMVMCRAFDKIHNLKSKKVVFCIDRYTDPEFGIDTKDFLAVYYWDESAWKFGVLEYDDGKTREIRWDHAAWGKWHKRFGDEIKQAMMQFLKVRS